MYHARRIENLADSLEMSGTPAVLTAAPRSGVKKVYVYPDSVDEGIQVSSDPLLTPRKAADAIVSALKSADAVVVNPPGSQRDLFRKILFHAPRSLRDFTTMLARIKRRLVGAN